MNTDITAPTKETIYTTENVIPAGTVFTVGTAGKTLNFNSNTAVWTVGASDTYTYLASNVITYSSFSPFTQLIQDICSAARLFESINSQNTIGDNILKSLDCNFSMSIYFSRLAQNVIKCGITILSINSSDARIILKSMKSLINVLRCQSDKITVEIKGIPAGLAEVLDAWVDMNASGYLLDSHGNIVIDALQYLSKTYDLEVRDQDLRAAQDFERWLSLHLVKGVAVVDNYNSYYTVKKIFIKAADLLPVNHPSYPEVPLFTEYIDATAGVYRIFLPDNRAPYLV